MEEKNLDCYDDLPKQYAYPRYQDRRVHFLAIKFRLLGLLFLNLHIGKIPHEINYFRIPSQLLSAAEHQECVCKIRIEPHEDVPKSMTLWIKVPLRDVLAKQTIKKPTNSPKEYGGQVYLCKPLCIDVLRVDIVFVHPGDAEKTENGVMYLEANSKASHCMHNCKCSTIEKQKGGHCASIVPIWRVEDVDI